MVLEGADPPPELTDARIVERFGWDFETLDQQDEGRTVRAVSLLNAAAALERVMSAIRRHSPGAASRNDWAIYKMLVDIDDD